MMGTFLGVPIIRTIVFGGLYWGPPILGNYHVKKDGGSKRRGCWSSDMLVTKPPPRQPLPHTHRCNQDHRRSRNNVSTISTRTIIGLLGHPPTRNLQDNESPRPSNLEVLFEGIWGGGGGGGPVRHGLRDAWQRIDADRPCKFLLVCVAG